VPPKFSSGTRVTQSYQLYLVRGNLHREGEGLRVVESHAHLGAPVGHLRPSSKVDALSECFSSYLFVRISFLPN